MESPNTMSSWMKRCS